MTIAKSAGTLFSTNVDLAKQAAVIEAGHVVVNRVAALVKPKLPIMVRGYIDEPIGKAVISNLVLAAVQNIPQTKANPILNKIAQGGVLDAQQQLLRSLDIDGLLASVLGDPAVAAVVGRVE